MAQNAVAAQAWAPVPTRVAAEPPLLDYSNLTVTA
jgi:hypothetical protein